MAMNSISILAVSEKDSFSAFQDKSLQVKDNSLNSGFSALLQGAEEQSDANENTDASVKNDLGSTIAALFEQQNNDDSEATKITIDKAIDGEATDPVINEDSDIQSTNFEDNITDKKLTDDNASLSGDLMLAQINSAQMVDTSVKKYSSDFVEKADISLTGNGKKPVDELTPIVASPQKLSNAELQSGQASDLNKVVEASSISETNSPIKALVKGNKDLELIVSQDKSVGELDKSASSLTPSQLDKLAVQVQALDKSNSNLATLKQMLEQYITSNEPNASKTDLNTEINKLTKAEKQELLAQLNSYIKNAQPQSEELASLKTTANDLTVSIDSELVQQVKTATVANANAQSDKSGITKLVPKQNENLKTDEIAQESAKVTNSLINEEKANQIEASSKEGLRNNNAEISTSRVAQLFTQITNTLSPQQASSYSSYNQLDYEQSITDIQTLQSQHIQSTAQTKQVSIDPNVMQAINIIKSDAAKLLQERVSSMLSINNKEAEIRLDPPEMGNMQIRIRSDAEQAQINFVVQNQQAKEALEQSLPRLREMLAQQGIELGESSISYGDSRDGNAEHDGSESDKRAVRAELAHEEKNEANNNQTQSYQQQNTSSIDYYA
ncbi:flagellar hook-length control protein FliK [Pseudoalteromonas aliena]|uniref:flagellar hook-length control protein FliK n=1 Tax=Pseudoalteromonas aliena TaxID=247523 RepID=UPI00311F6F91